MKQSTSSYPKTPHNFFSEEEIEVAAIISDLGGIISESERRHRLSLLKWTGRWRRSALDNTTPSPQRQLTDGRIPSCKATTAVATSPSTPLSFSPSDSDNKSRLSLKINLKKRTREEIIEIIDELTQSGEVLRREVDTVRDCYQKLNAINLNLKAEKQELSGCQKTEITEKNFRFQDRYHYGQSVPPILSSPPSSSPYTGLGLGLGRVNKVNPRGIPDLNVSAEEASFQPLDLNNTYSYRLRAAAEARKSRLLKLRLSRGR